MYQLYVKSDDDYQLTHVYEHLVFDHVERILTRQGFIYIIDYDIVPVTNYGGTIVVQAWFAGQAVKRAFETSLDDSLNIKASVSAIRLAVGQVECETLSRIAYDTEKCRLALRELGGKPWLRMDTIGTIDAGRPATSIRSSGSPYFNAQHEPKRFNRVQIDYTLKNSAYSEAPARLYVMEHIIDLLLHGLRQEAARGGLPMYWTHTTYGRTRKQARASQYLIFPQPYDDNRVFEVLASAAAYLKANDWEQRFLDFMQTQATKGRYFADAVNELYAHYGVIVGTDAIRRELRPEVIEDIMAALVIKLP